MNIYQNLVKGRSRTLGILGSITGLALTYYFTALFLETNFPYSGEAYMQGAGHLLTEDFTKGVVFLISRHLIASVFLFSVVLLLSTPIHSATLFKILNILALIALALTLTYTVYKLFDIYGNGYYDQLNRVVEISFTWIMRIAGMYIAYLIRRRKNNQAAMNGS